MEERISKALEIATDTKVFEMGPGASAVAPEVFGNLFPGRKAVVIADVNTWPVLGEKVFKLFRSAGIPVSEYVIDKKEFHAEWKYVEMLDAILDGDTAKARTIENDPQHVEADAESAFRNPSEDYPVAVSVGSGVINASSLPITTDSPTSRSLPQLPSTVIPRSELRFPTGIPSRHSPVRLRSRSSPTSMSLPPHRRR